MSNFWKQKLARESADAVLEPGSIELPEEAVEAHLEEVQEDTAEIELLERDGAVLADDTDETESQLELVDEGIDEETGETEGDDLTEDDVEALDVAQESIRKRWGINTTRVAQECRGSSRSRRLIARESLVSDAKALIQRFIDWLKEMGRKLKDRWMKFSNAGKTVQARAKKYDAIISKLGAKKDDDIKGSFIKQLSVGASFIGDDKSALVGWITKAEGCQDAAKEMYDGIAAEIAKSAKGSQDGYAPIINKDTVFGSGTTQVIGGYAVTAEAATSGDDHFETLEFVASEDSVEEKIATPSTSALAMLVDVYTLVGKKLEAQLQAYHKTNQAREKLEKAMEQIMKSIGDLEAAEGAEGGDKPTKGSPQRARKAATAAAQKAAKFDAIASHIWKTIPSGLGGFIGAGIGAYAKK